MTPPTKSTNDTWKKWNHHSFKVIGSVHQNTNLNCLSGKRTKWQWVIPVSVAAGKQSGHETPAFLLHPYQVHTCKPSRSGGSLQTLWHLRMCNWSTSCSESAAELCRAGVTGTTSQTPPPSPDAGNCSLFSGLSWRLGSDQLWWASTWRDQVFLIHVVPLSVNYLQVYLKNRGWISWINKKTPALLQMFNSNTKQCFFLTAVSSPWVLSPLSSPLSLSPCRDHLSTCSKLSDLTDGWVLDGVGFDFQGLVICHLD